ncbi:MAG: hypothetical protein ACXAC6_05160 [Candidatus Hodarchaeales archaeon]|jgi:hypothetical protein
MKIYRSNIVLIILLVNITGLPFLFSTTRTSDLSQSYFSGNSNYIKSESDPLPLDVSLAIQDDISIVLNKSIDSDNQSFTFIYNIWDETLSSDPYVIASPELYENGIIYPAEGEIDSDALFVRIGNSGTNKTNLDAFLNTEILYGISAGWQLDFPVDQDYDAIKLSFKWRFDAFDPSAFDDYDELIPGEPLDASPDYQEIRCRINSPSGSQESFWLGNAVSDSNPNGSIFYRVGSNITQDEEWFNFTGSFQVPRNDTANYTLDLGAFLNTREYWNEYFDVWFDDILIEGVSNITDINPPVPTDFGLSRFETDNTSFSFWMNHSIGSWESPIENVTVYYNLTKDLITSYLNSSLVESNFFSTNNAGFNQTFWNFTAKFDFDDIISFKFVIFDESNNSYTTPTTVVVIDDVVAPWIPPGDEVIISQYGDGRIQILANVTDWGFGVDKVSINYSVNGEIKSLTALSALQLFNESGIDITLFGVNLTVNYGDLLNFNLLLNDSIGNHDHTSYVGYSVEAEVDSIYPSITEFSFYADNETEDRSYIRVGAQDSFGEIDRVLLNVLSPSGELSNYRLGYDNISSYYIPQSPDNLLELEYVDPEEPYNLTVIIRDKAGLETSNSSLYIVKDIVAPEISESNVQKEYLIPGNLRIRVFTQDTGSGLRNVSLLRKEGSSWSDPITTDTEDSIYFDLTTDLIGNQKIVFKIEVIDNAGNTNEITIEYMTPLFVTTTSGLLLSEALAILVVVGLFSAVKLTQKRKLRTVRRHRFDVATRRSERLAYIGEEAMFGFVWKR